MLLELSFIVEVNHQLKFSGLVLVSAFSHEVGIPAHERFWLTRGWLDVAVRCCGAG